MSRNIVADNFYSGAGSVYTLKQRMKKIIKAGGNVYDVLFMSGLLELVRNGILSPETEDEINDTSKEVLGKSKLLALEVCVEFADEEMLDRVYLCCADMREYRSLLDKGIVRRGELILAYEVLEELAGLGYACICTDSENEPRYKQYFGDKAKLCHVREEQKKNIAKNGFNVVCLVLEDAQTYQLIRADLYAFETCLSVLQTEEEIRKYIDPFFFVEKISFKSLTEYEDIKDVPPFGEEVLLMLQPGTPGVFLSEAGLQVEDYSPYYARLAYQTAYMQYHYPQLENVKKEIEDQREYTNALGIELDLNVSRGAMYRSKNEVKLVLRQKSELDFEGFTTLSDLGVAASEMGKCIRRIIKKAEGYVDMETASVVICLPTELLSVEEAEKALDELERKIETDPQAALSLLLYEELELQEAGTYDCVRKAVELAGLTNVALVPRALCIVAAYEHMDKENVLVGYENGLVFDWNLDYLCITVVSRLGDEDVNILNQKIVRLPMEDFDIKETLRHELEITMDESMYDETIFDFFFDESEDVDATREEKQYRYYMADNVLHQLIRCPYANLILDDCMFADKVERYIGVYFEQEVMAPLMEKIEDLIRGVLDGVQFVPEDITKVYLSGELGNYPYLLKCLRDLCAVGANIYIMDDTKYAAVKGAAYLAYDNLVNEEKS